MHGGPGAGPFPPLGVTWRTVERSRLSCSQYRRRSPGRDPRRQRAPRRLRPAAAERRDPMQTPISQFWQRLHAWSERREHKLAALKSQSDASAEAECTFRPAVLARSLAIASKPSSGATTLAHKRVQALRHELAHKELSECTFHPKIVERSRELASRLSRATMRSVLIAVDHDPPAPTFQPKITSIWRRLPRVRQYCNIAAPERLLRPAPFSNQRKDETASECDRGESIDRTRIAAFCQRQEQSLRVKQRKLEQARTARFAPTSSMPPATRAALDAFAMRQEEGWRRKVSDIAEIQNELEMGWRFTPAINRRSQRLGESSRYRTRVTTTRTKRQHDARPPSRTQRQQRPAPNKVAGSMDEFLQRQEQFAEMKKKRLAQRQSQYGNNDAILAANIEQMQKLKLNALTPYERQLRATMFARRNMAAKRRSDASESSSDQDDDSVDENFLHISNQDDIAEFRLHDPATFIEGVIK